MILAISLTYLHFYPESIQKLIAASYTFTVPDDSDWSEGTYDNTEKSGTDLVLTNKTLLWLETTTANFGAGTQTTNVTTTSDEVALDADNSSSLTTGNSKLNTSDNINDTYYFIATDAGLDVIDPSDDSSKGYVSHAGGFSSVTANSTSVYAGDADGGVFKYTIANISGSTAEGTATYTTTSAPAIISNNVNDVHVATISAKTYLAVATSGGVTVVNETDGISTSSSEATAYDAVFLTTDDKLYYGDDGNTNLQRKDTISEATDGFSATREYSTSSTPDLFNANINDIYVTVDTSTAEGTSNTVFLATDGDIEVIQEHSTMGSSAIKHYDYTNNWALTTNDSTLEDYGGGSNPGRLNDGNLTNYWDQSWSSNDFFTFSFKEEDEYLFYKLSLKNAADTTALKQFRIFTSSEAAAKSDPLDSSWSEVDLQSGSSTDQANLINKWVDLDGTLEADGGGHVYTPSACINDGLLYSYTYAGWKQDWSSDSYFIFSFEDEEADTVNQLNLYQRAADTTATKQFQVYTTTDSDAKTDPLHSSWEDAEVTVATGSSTDKANLINKWVDMDGTLEAACEGHVYTPSAYINDGLLYSYTYAGWKQDWSSDSYFIFSFEDEEADTVNQLNLYQRAADTTATKQFQVYTTTDSDAKTDPLHSSWEDAEVTVATGSSTDKANLINKWVDMDGTLEADSGGHIYNPAAHINDGLLYSGTYWGWCHANVSSDYFIFSFEDEEADTVNQLNLYQRAADATAIKQFKVFTSSEADAKTDPTHASWSQVTSLTGSSSETKANLVNRWSDEDGTLEAYKNGSNADNVNDALTWSAWESSWGTTDGYFIFSFENYNAKTINKLNLYNRGTARDVKNFNVKVSSDDNARTDPDHASWVIAYSGTALQQTAVQEFTWDDVAAKYVQFQIVDNYGDGAVGYYEVEIYGTETLQDENIFVAEQTTSVQSFTWSDVESKYVLFRILNNYGSTNRCLNELEVYGTPTLEDENVFQAEQTTSVQSFTWDPANANYVMFRMLNNYGSVTRGINELEVYGTPTLQDEDIFVAAQDTGSMQDFTWTAESVKYVQLRVLNNFGSATRKIYELEYYNDGPLAGTTNKATGVTANADGSTMWAATNDTGENDGAVSEITVSDGTQANYYQSAATTPTILDNDTVAIAGDADANNLVVGTADAGVSALEKEGVFVSQINDFGTSNTEWGTVSWNATLGTQTMTVKARTSNDSGMSGATAWDSVDTITSGDDISGKTGVTDGHRYLQYRLDFTSTAYDENPSLQDITLNAGKLYGTHTIDFDASGEAGWYTMEWTVGDEPAGTDMKFRFKTSPDNIDWSEAWSSYIDTSPADLGVAGLNLTDNRYLRIQTYLETTSNGATPQVDDFTVSYIQNGPPELQNITVSQGSDGIVNISYQIRDSDTDSGTVNSGFADVTFQYWDGDSWEECDTTTGEGLKAVEEVAYTPYTATWTATTDFADQYFADTVKIRVNADDNELLYNSTSADSLTFELDTKTPSLGATPVTINSAANKTNSTSVTLTVSASDDTALYMTFSNDGATYGTIVDEDGEVTNSGTWEGYTTAKAWTLTSGADGARTAYVKFKDAKGNTTTAQSDGITLDTAATNIPTNISIADGSDKGIERYQLLVSWNPVSAAQNLDFDHYLIEMSTDGVSYSTESTLSDINDDIYVDKNLSPDIIYYYRLKTVDNISNASDPSSVVTYQPASQDDTPPDLSGELPVSVCTQTACTVGWTTDESATSCVEHGLDTDYGNIECELDFVLIHEVGIDDLTAGTTYHYRVISKDADGNQATGTDNTMITQTSTDDTDPPDLSGEGPIVSPADVSAAIAWVTDEKADSFVEFGLTTDYGSLQGSETLVTDHIITIIGLTSQKTYHYRVKSTDAAGNTTTTEDDTFTTTLPQEANDPPEISDIISQAPGVSTTSVTISWTTDTYSSSQVLYGKTNELGDETEEDTVLNKNHYVTITGLESGTTYYYKVRSEDTYGNVTTSDTSNFTTAAEEIITDPQISGIVVQTPGAASTSVTIIWATDTDTTSQVLYGTTTDLGLESDKDTTYTKKHYFTLTDLTPNTKYFYKLKSEDASGNITLSDIKNFTTAPEEVISDPQISDIVAQTPGAAATSVTIIWMTDTDTTSQILYGTTESLGQETAKDETYTKKHFFAITGLTPNTKYFYKVKSEDAQGNVTISDLKTFSTTKQLTGNPKISGVQVTDITLNSAIISWNTFQVTTSDLQYGPTSSYGSSIVDESLSLTTIHVARLSGLASGAAYHFRIFSKDADGNDIASDDYVFNTQTFPEISSVNITDIIDRQANVSWTTNVETSGVVEYGVDTNYGQSQGLSDFTIPHQVALIGLEPSTLYHLRVKGRDIYGNEGTSGDYTVRTLQDSNPPIISGVEYEVSTVSGKEGKVQAIISWSTDELATSQLLYQKGIAPPSDAESYQAQTQEDPNLNISHVVIISDMDASSTYHFMVKSKDQNNNTTISEDFSMLTPPQTRSVLGEIITSLEARFVWLSKLKDIFGF